MRILIAGASGFIGMKLVSFLEKQGHVVDRLVRSGTKGVVWAPELGEIDVARLEGFDAIINLAGENIASARWTEGKKQRIRNSRVLSTKTLAKAITELRNPPQVWINASAIGYYGNKGDQLVDESFAQGQGFLAEVCAEWEEATHPAKERGVRVVTMRLGVVLSIEGGVLRKMLLPFLLGVGGVLGSGKQWMSWIALSDLLAAIAFILKQEALRDAVNVVAPEPVTNYTFTKTLGRYLWRPTLLWMPRWFVKTAFGEMGDELFLTSGRALPKKLQMAGFTFRYPTLEQALKLEKLN